jgi:hypothetical protein
LCANRFDVFKNKTCKTNSYIFGLIKIKSILSRKPYYFIDFINK